MKTLSRWIRRGVLLIAAIVVLVACGSPSLPPPVAATSTPLPPPPTEAPTSTPLPPPPTEVPTSTPTPAPTDTPRPAPTEAAEKPSADLAEAANAKQIYTQNGCSGCHGANYEGGFGMILAGLPLERIQSATRKGKPEAGMPAFDQNAISDDDLGTLAGFLSGLTLQDIGVEVPPDVVDQLSQARDALQSGDKAAVETHLKKAQEIGADAPPGIQATLKGLVEGLEEADWMEVTEVPLKVLLGQ